MRLFRLATLLYRLDKTTLLELLVVYRDVNRHLSRHMLEDDDNQKMLARFSV
jgi:hypothetical protein